MKIAIYTIAKNEEQFVDRWVSSGAGANFTLILDTGSTDNTVEKAREYGVEVHTQVFDPWRFDSARNAALALIPDDIDYCIALDMDEVLVLKKSWQDICESIPKGTTRPRYKYTWSWNADGSEGLVYAGDKIHSRHDYSWKHPVHEVLKPLSGEETTCWVDGLEIHHHPDPNKSRSQYLPLLEMAVAEEPNDDRNRFYLGREYFFNNRYAEATEQFKAHLALSMWSPERAASCRYLAQTTGNKTMWLHRAIGEDPGRRESWVDLALYLYIQSDWRGCWWASNKAIEITEKPLDYLCEAYAWGFMAYDLAAVSAHNLGFHDEALKFGRRAVELNPDDMRLVTNLSFYEALCQPKDLG